MDLLSEYVPVSCGPSDSGGCGTEFAMTRVFYDEMKRTGKTWYCPKGHPRVYGGPTTEQRLRDAEAREVHLRDQLLAAERAAEGARVALARARWRFANGVCPCCNRQFQNVLRHVQTKHPEYTAAQAEVLVPKAEAFRCSCDRTFTTPRGLAIHQGHARDERWDDPKRHAWYRHLTMTG